MFAIPPHAQASAYGPLVSLYAVEISPMRRSCESAEELRGVGLRRLGSYRDWVQGKAK